jgi:hypothetical protein
VLVSTGLADYLNLIFETPPTQWQSCPPRQELSDAQMGKSFTFQFYPIIEATVLRGVAILLLPKPTGKTEQVASLHRAQLNALLRLSKSPVFLSIADFSLARPATAFCVCSARIAQGKVKPVTRRYSAAKSMREMSGRQSVRDGQQRVQIAPTAAPRCRLLLCPGFGGVAG